MKKGKVLLADFKRIEKEVGLAIIETLKQIKKNTGRTEFSMYGDEDTKFNLDFFNSNDAKDMQFQGINTDGDFIICSNWQRLSILSQIEYGSVSLKTAIKLLNELECFIPNLSEFKVV